MAAYSLDLRERIVEAVERQIGSKRKIAELFGVHESFIYKLLRQRRERGDIAPLPHGGGAHAKLSADQQRLEIEDLIFLDEFGLNLAMTRTHARAPVGERVQVTEPFHHGGSISVISAMGVQGVCAPMTIDGAFNSEIFARYVEHLLVPGLRPGNIVLL